jgi:hypothetical protein
VIKILTKPCTFNPAKMIADLINQDIECKVTTHPEFIRDNDTYVRYGCNTIVNHGTDSMINSINFINLVGNKINFSHKLLEHNIYTPEYHNSGIPNEFPCVIRETLTGMGGIGIHFINNREEFNAKWRTGYYWTKFYNCEFELRAHILGGEVNRIFKKTKEDEDRFPIRNSQNGYHFSLRTVSNYPKVDELVEALESINPINEEGGFYALDLGYDNSTHQYLVYEANSAPGLSEPTSIEYANYIKECLE